MPDLEKDEQLRLSFRANVTQGDIGNGANIWVTSKYVRARFSRMSRWLRSTDVDLPIQWIEAIRIEGPSLIRGPHTVRFRTQIKFDLSSGETLYMLVREPHEIAERLRQIVFGDPDA